ncbi:prepilin-type N-terminal cleavage/methylation domain-containing protein [Anabaena sphaerica FACHB-251]|uniref:Prepilin-type N-terminal cleavage/methylation domain-containing protein n=1 Tax=Anabaena sphaerica FACHB-251 TaxID=2692883 RepID=A0A927A1J8_9NOST|nr:type IV pilin-like G/H family protein [Anabaena sphaerica]MBD2293495.1 prepilin-type N-terminal cleavage/methylation domain-containing protein [Anabaena sphaerica FACHB-251]
MIQHYIFKNNDQGMTALELILVLIVITILAAMALPSFIVQTSPGVKLLEGKIYVNSINRGQEAYFFEKKKFSASVEELGLGIATQTDKYNYSIKLAKDSAYHYGIARTETFKSYIGGVFILPDAKDLNTKIVTTTGIITISPNPILEKPEIKTISILCVKDQPGNFIPSQPSFKNGIATCGAGTTQVKR